MENSTEMEKSVEAEFGDLLGFLEPAEPATPTEPVPPQPPINHSNQREFVDQPVRDFILLNGELAEICGNYRAWYTLELTTGKPFAKALSDYCNETGGVGSFIAVFWSLLSTWRYRNKKMYAWRLGEREEGYKIPGAFVDMLPVGGPMEEIREKVYLLLVNGGYIVEEYRGEGKGDEKKGGSEDESSDPPTPVSA